MEGATCTQREGEAPVVSGGDVGAGPLIGDLLDLARVPTRARSAAVTLDRGSGSSTSPSFSPGLRR